jgi:hypothetical protein
MRRITKEQQQRYVDPQSKTQSTVQKLVPHYMLSQNIIRYMEKDKTVLFANLVLWLL